MSGKAERTLRMPRSPAAQLRSDMRRLGVRRAARLWGLPPNDCLRIGAGIAAPRDSVVAALRRVLARLEAGR
jgi:hypothetical protein